MQNEVKSITGLRALCALAVFFFHTKVIEGGAFQFHPPFVVAALQYGVELFFMISGYLIPSVLVRGRSLRDFAFNRFFRIYPVFAVIIGLLFIVGPHTRWNENFFADFHGMALVNLFASNFLMLPGMFDLPIVLSVAWSLSYELAFYIFAGVVVYLARRNKGLAWTVGVVCGALLCVYKPRALFFAAGALAYFLDKRDIRIKIPGSMQLALVVGIFGCLGLNPESKTIGIELCGCVLGVLFFVSILHEGTWFNRMLQSGVMRHLGLVSYSFYLWHTLVISGVVIVWKMLLPHDSILKMPVLIIAGLLLAVAVSTFSYRCIEQKMNMRNVSMFFSKIRLRSIPATE